MLMCRLQSEAAMARRRILEEQDTSTAQVHEATWSREVLRIYDEARPETKAVYQFGHDADTGAAPDNWIIRWVMWHVFRYRDYRNKGRPPRNGIRTSATPSTTDDEMHDSAPAQSLSQEVSTDSASSNNNSASITRQESLSCESAFICCAMSCLIDQYV